MKNCPLTNETIRSGKFKSSDEIVAIVDKENRFIRGATRQEMRLHNLIHRSTGIILLDPTSSEMFIHKRTTTKEWCPGFYDIGFGGVVGANETDQENVIRELYEESGLIKSIEEIQFLGTSYYEDAFCRVFTSFWVTTFERQAEDLTPEAAEIEFIEKVTIDEVAQRLESGHLFTPTGKQGFYFCKDKLHAMTQQGDKAQS